MAEQEDGDQEAETGAGDTAEIEVLGKEGDAAFQEHFDKIDTDHDDEEDLHVASASDEGGGDDEEDEEGEPSDEDDDADDQGATTKAAAGDEEDAEEDEEDEELKLHRAYTTLHDKLDVPASVLKSMPRAKLIAWAERVEARGAGASEPSESTEQGRETPEGAKASSEPAQAASSDWATIRSGIAEKFGVEEEAAEGIKPLHDSQESLRAEVKELRALVEGATAAARAREGQATIDTQMRRLAAKYPQLERSASARERLIREAEVLVKGGLKNAEKVFDKAALLALGSPKRADLGEFRRRGVSHPPEVNGGRSAVAHDEDEYFARVIDQVDAGRLDAARRIKPPPPPRQEKQKRR